MSQKQKDEREYPLPLKYSHLKDQGYKALKYGHTLYLSGPGLTTKISDEIHRKINDNMSVVICVTGPPGQGKTYFGKRYAQKLDSDFNINDIPPPPPNEDDGQTTFSREQLAYLTGENSPLHRGQVILTDESHWGIGARSWQNRDQQEIVNYLAAIRSKGYILIIVVLHTRMIDTLLRDFVINYEFHVTTRGEATIYRRWFPIHAKEPYRRKLGKMRLQLPDEHLCNYDSCLRGRNGCKYLHKPPGQERCLTIRAIYERRKKHFLDEKGRKEEAEHRATKYDTLDQIILKINPHKEKIPRKRNGEIHKARFIVWIRELGCNIRAREESTLLQLAKETYG